MEVYLATGAAALAASMISLFSGFGLATLVMPVFAVFFPIPVAVASTAVVHVLNNLFKLVLLGKKKEVIGGDAIWLCCSCYNCQERCPQKVEIAELIYALRNIAIEAKNIPKIYSEFEKALMSEGRIVSISKFMENRRSDHGLPPLQRTGVEPLRRILAAAGQRVEKEVGTR